MATSIKLSQSRLCMAETRLSAWREYRISIFSARHYSINKTVLKLDTVGVRIRKRHHHYWSEIYRFWLSLFSGNYFKQSNHITSTIFKLRSDHVGESFFELLCINVILFHTFLHTLQALLVAHILYLALYQYYLSNISACCQYLE